MYHGLLSRDTTPDVERRLIERWRAMSPEEKLSVAIDMSETVRQLSVAGIRQRHPNATPREQFLRLAILRLGRDLALRAYPDAAGLDMA